MRLPIRNAGLFLSLSLVALCLPGYAAAPSDAARVEFVLGTAQVVSAIGEPREVIRGMSIQVGDTVISEDARLQLRFGDGSFVALAPGSEFRVNAFSWNGVSDGTERLSMTLLKGGLRTVTGLIGKAMQSAYEMATGVATIGIRGTEYTIVHGRSITGTVAEGRIAVCNGAGCIEVSPGQSFYVKDANTKPAFTDKAAHLPPPAPGRADSQNLAAGTRLDESLRLSEFPQLAISANDPLPDTDQTRGIGFVLIGTTAPNVVEPAQRVSDILQQDTPGNGNGPGLGFGNGQGNGKGNDRP